MWDKAERTEAPQRPRHGYATIADIMRSLNPSPASFIAMLADKPARPGNVLPDGRAPRPSVDALSGGVGTVATIQIFTEYLVPLMKYIEFMKRAVPCTTTCSIFSTRRCRDTSRWDSAVFCSDAGGFNDPDDCDLHVQEHVGMGPQRCMSPPASSSTGNGHGRFGRDQPRHSNPAGQLLLRGLGRPRDVRQNRSAGQSCRSAASMEPDNVPKASETRFPQQIHLGDVSTLVRQTNRRTSRARYRRRSACPTMVYRS